MRTPAVGMGAAARRQATNWLLLFVCFSALAFVYRSRGWLGEPSVLHRGPMVVSSDIELANNLESIVLERFDKLVASGDILYEASEPEIVQHKGFEFEFRIVSFLDRKPISAPNSLDRTKAGGPFENPAPQEVIATVGSSHQLLVNKYCAYRPMLVLPRIKYAPQTDDLEESDIAAAWVVLRAFKTPQMVIYNCGVNAGSSQGHKHLQVFPLENSMSQGLFPERATSSEHINDAIPNVPFIHFVLRISATATSRDVYWKYCRLLEETRKALDLARAGHDYNVVFTADWIALVPRRTAVWGGPFGANAAGMLGIVTVPNKQQKDQWAELGYTEYLVRLGIPRA